MPDIPLSDFDPKEIITHLTLESFKYRKAYLESLEKIKILEKEFQDSKDELSKTIPVRYLSEFVKEQFALGKIPYPLDVVDSALSVTLHCGPENILFGEKGVVTADVTFSLGRHDSSTHTYFFSIKEKV
ncbi:MAG: hypothetical protein KBC41_03220 [Candidatus Pacebacteria bacterium]|nr:hypothetical protein [Candidatus Paceibacterota bacterium]MBP9867058.1 hypothetical protein [Candidatus Paceibacterota bacterium]